MITLTRLNQATVVVNSDLIETIEATPDTLLCLSNGQKLIVLEKPGEIIERILRFRSAVAGSSAERLPQISGFENCWPGGI